MGPAGADHAELFLGDRDRLFHLFLGVEEGVVDHCGLLWRAFLPVTKLTG
jgi:hypothetical protein